MTLPVKPSSRERRCAGLLERKPFWVPTLRGWLLLLLCGAGITCVLVGQLYPFLALNEPVQAECLVVEGWVSDYALEFAAAEFRKQSYPRLFTTGGPLEKGSFLSSHKNYAEVAAATLRQLGLASNAVIAVAAPKTRMDRTYQSALALRKWLGESGQPVKAMNVITIGAHARRTRLLYQEAFGESFTVGVIAVPPSGYDPKRWWGFSAGLREMISESIGYVYAKISSP